MTFRVKNLTPPAGFVIVAKYEWFVNGVSVKINTSTPSDFGLEWQIKSKTTTVYCKVTYKKQDSTLSQVFTSSSFTPNVKQLNFRENGITATTALPNFGCTTNTVSFGLNPFVCTGMFCSDIFSVGQYNITWQPPSGWIQTNISTNGNNVSFLPDASTGGTLTATITLPCGFIDTRTFTVNRVSEKPTFSSSNNNNVCTSSANFAINPTCGATNYAYTIVGNSGITFAANGLQSLTTSNTSPTLNFSGSSASALLKAKANYPGGNVSAEESSEIIYGTQTPSNIYGIQPTIAVSQGELLELDADNAGLTSYNWSVEGGTIRGYSNLSHVTIEVDRCYGQYNGWLNVHLSYNNACGTGDTYTEYTTIDCNTGGGPLFAMSPNPARDYVTIDGRKKDKSIKEIQIVDKFGNIKRMSKYSGDIKLLNFTISGLPADVYYLKVFDGQKWESKQLRIQ